MRVCSMMVLALVSFLLLNQGAASAKIKGRCSLPKGLVSEIRSYKKEVETIFNALVNGTLSGAVWSHLATFIDRFGPRMTGTKNLENAIDYVVGRSRAYKLDNVHTEPVEAPYWVRGHESATVLSPRLKKLDMLGIGGSVGTPQPDGISAEAIVVEDFKELSLRAAEVPGKIVVFAQKWAGYHKTKHYRTLSASKAAKLGAVATLVRSITPFSLHTPHTGQMTYAKGVRKIPAACITIEDSKALLRFDRRGEKIFINLKMEAQRLPNVTSRNTIAELTGHPLSHQYVLVSGHLDSWDIGEGVVDDGAGAFVAWYIPILLKTLGLIPRRTVRSVLWTGEEQGLYGALAYKKAHSDHDIVMIMESDEGTFNPTGMSMKGSVEATCIFEEILKLLAPINVTELTVSKKVGSDISIWSESLVPEAHLTANGGDKYFWYHHTGADDMTAVNSDSIDKCLAAWAAVTYVVADLSVQIPRGAFQVSDGSLGALMTNVE